MFLHIRVAPIHNTTSSPPLTVSSSPPSVYRHTTDIKEVHTLYSVTLCTQLGLPRVLEYSRVLDSKNYSSKFLLLEYRSILLPVANFHFRFQFLQIKLLICCKFGLYDLYVNNYFQLPTSLQYKE